MDWYIPEIPKKFETHFASPERSTMPELLYELSVVSKSKIIDAIIRSTGSLLAVLNKNRQVLMLNGHFLKVFNIKNSDEVLGLRPGEMVKCVHSNEMESGCGTSEYCKTCGAVISIITALETNDPAEEKCIIDVGKGILFLKVRSVPTEVEGIKVILLFAEDISEIEFSRSVNHYFFNNLKRNLETMRHYIDILQMERPVGIVPTISYLDKLAYLNSKIYRDIDLHKIILTENIYDAFPILKKESVSSLLSKLREHYSDQHKINKDINIDWSFEDNIFLTDEIIFLKIMTNLVDNALEHTKDEVKIWIEVFEKYIKFNVWNDEEIEKNVAKRVFQKFFTTKKEYGHGFGTFVAKFLAENTLKGRLYFTTGGDGTVFSFEHPRI